MNSPTTPPTTFRASRVEPELPLPLELGLLGVDAQAHWRVAATVPGLERYLERLVETLNGLDEVRIKTEPPSGAPPFSVAFRSVPRRAPGWLDALRIHVEQRHGVQLEPMTG